MRHFFLIFLYCLCCFLSSAQSQQIKITVHGLENSSMILASYYGDKKFAKDTIQFNGQGELMIHPDTMLPGGVYLAIFPKLDNKYFEFVIAEPQFSIETDAFDLAKHLKVNGSEENRLFYEDMRFLSHKKELTDSLVKLYKASKDDNEKNKYKEQLQEMDKAVKDKRNSVITTYPTLFYSKMLNAMKDVTVPEAPRDANGRLIDTAWQWRYYKMHYWDNIDLSDERLVRTPVFYNKLKVYLTQTTVQTPDSINASEDDLIRKTDMQGEVYHYIINYIFNELRHSNSPNAPVIDWGESTKIEYGTIARGDESNAGAQFIFTNVGRSALIISECHASCGCVVPTCPSEPIEPGAKGTISVHYDVNRVGEFTKTITVTSNANDRNTTVLIHGIVTN